MAHRVLLVISALLFPLPAILHAGTIGGILFEDQNRNGVHDARERTLANVEVKLLGLKGSVLETTHTDGGGHYRFAGLKNGNYVVSAQPGSQWRASFQDRGADLTPVPNFPFCRPRYASMQSLVDTLLSSGGVSHDYRHVALGDSIAYGFNFCGSFFGNHGYIELTTQRLREATVSHVITDKQAILGHATAQLLDPGLGPDSSTLENDVFYAIREHAPLVSISIGGNDFLDSEGGGDSAIAAAIVRARRNLQEILSALVTGVPGGEAELNTVYDNLQGSDARHNVWAPLWDQMLREQAWGQARRVMLAEIYPEYAHEENGQIRGQTGLICRFLGVDGVHPTGFGYTVHQEKLWQALGGVTLRDSDRLDLDLGYVEMAGGRLPTQTQDVTGNTIHDRLALMPDGAGALVPANNAEFRVSDFTAPARELLGPHDFESGDLAQAVLKVRYRTLGAPVDDYYTIEASVDGTFRSPGSTPSTWNTILPVVGSSGNDGAEWLVFPYQPTFRTVAAPLYVGAPRDARTTLTWDDLKTVTVRVLTHAVNTPDAYAIELDAAWVDYATIPPGTSYARGEPQWRATLPRLMATDRDAARRLLRTAIAHGELAGELVAQFGELAEPTDIAALQALSAHPDPMIRAHALRALASLTDASAELAVATQDPAESVRVATAEHLGRVAADLQTTLCFTLARDASPRVRVAAIAAVAAPAALLHDLLGDAEESVRVEAASQLLARGDDSGWRILATALAQGERSARILRAIEAAPAWIESLVREAWIASTSPLARARLVRALASRQHAERATIEFLHALLNEPELSTRAAAIDALARLDPESSPLIAALADTPALSINVTRALEHLQDSRSFDLLSRIAASSTVNGTARYIAARALGRCTDPLVVPYLRQLLESADENVRSLAESGIAARR